MTLFTWWHFIGRAKNVHFESQTGTLLLRKLRLIGVHFKFPTGTFLCGAGVNI